MGSPKHELALSDGRTMLQHVIDAVSAVTSRVVLIGSNIPEQSEGNVHVADLRPDAGPLAGIEALLASGLDSQYLVCPCDVPFVTSDLLRSLLSSSESLATVFQMEGRDAIEPLPARIHSEVLPVVRRLLNAQKRSVWQLMQEIKPQLITITAQQPMALHNVNTQADFDDAVRLMNEGQRIATRG